MKVKVVTVYETYATRDNDDIEGFEEALQIELSMLGNIIIHSINYSISTGKFSEDNETQEGDQDYSLHSALILYDEVPTRTVITEKT
jgi:hypothetical protein